MSRARLLLALCALISACRSPARAGDELDARDEEGRTLHFRIDGVEKDAQDKGGDVSLYELSFLDPATGQWAKYCVPDIEGRSRAIPVKGSWDARATYVPGSEDKTTFACTSGAIGKCVRFGYKPWKNLLAQHQACIRMVRADYCGDGRPHTKNGTKIDIWDREGIQVREAERPGHPEVFEAAWGPDGAEHLAIPRWSDDLAEIVAECPERLRDHSGGGKTLAEIEAAHPRALVFNGRFVNEADRWFHPGGDPLATK